MLAFSKPHKHSAHAQRMTRTPERHTEGACGRSFSRVIAESLVEQATAAAEEASAVAVS